MIAKKRALSQTHQIGKSYDFKHLQATKILNVYISYSNCPFVHLPDKFPSVTETKEESRIIRVEVKLT